MKSQSRPIWFRSPLAWIVLPVIGGFLLSPPFPVLAQGYESQIENPIVHYKISARLDSKTKQVKGHYRLRWRNHTADQVSELYFHLYLNAFKNLDSTFMRETAAVGRRRERLADWKTPVESDKWGWVNVDRIALATGPNLRSLMTFVQPDDGNPADQTVMKVSLLEPVGPNETIELDIDFTSKLPRGLARTGFHGDFFMVAQWFPKIGVYEAEGERGRSESGWNCHQFHANTEFYANFGVYDVDLTVPSAFVVGATGSELDRTTNSDGTTTYHFYQEDVHDFAWTASPDMVKIEKPFVPDEQVSRKELEEWADRLGLPIEEIRLRDVKVTLLIQPQHLAQAERYFRAVFYAIKYFGLWYGAYPYETLTLLDPPPGSRAGGMEYPTLITGGTRMWSPAASQVPERVTVHEFGHQFWYGLVANNEFEEAWLDEGFNSYSTAKVMEVAYGPRVTYWWLGGLPVPGYPWLNVPIPSFPWDGVKNIPMGELFSRVSRHWTVSRRASYLERAESDDLVREGWYYLDGPSYVVNSYSRPALALLALERTLGEDVMARVMRTFHQRWRFKHPITRDFIRTAEEISGRNLDEFFDNYFYSSRRFDYAVTDIRNDPRRGPVGIYEEDSGKATHGEEQAEEAFAASEEKRYDSTVVVRRLGDGEAPVEIEVHFEDETKVREQWDGRYRWIKLTYKNSPKVTFAEVDPEGTLVLDANLTNNSFRVEEDERGAMKWFVRWVFWLQNLFFAFAFFS